MTNPHLEGLIRKWRDESADALGSAGEAAHAKRMITAAAKHSVGTRLAWCADELEAALAALPGGGDKVRELADIWEEVGPVGYLTYADASRFLRAALAALPGGGVDELRAALQQIAALDYSRAATNGAAYQAVHIAKTALSPTPNPHEADRNGND